MLIVSYDFTNDKIRAGFSKFLKQYGERIQYSVFSVHNSPRVLRNIVAEVEARYKKLFKNTDSVVIFSTCGGCNKKIVR